jgi:phosphohistidine phosphatase
MKTIYLVRHAKSDWENALTSDFDRPLNARGTKSAPVMASLLKKMDVLPELIISSPANRAITTAELFCEILGYPKELIKQRIEIYEGGSQMLLKIVREMSDSCKIVMLFGHNPTITQFSNLLTGNHIDSLVTCGVVRIDLEINSWKEAAADTGKIVWYEFPKKQH